MACVRTVHKRLEFLALDGFEELFSAFSENPDISKMLASKNEYLESALISFVQNIVNRYLYETNKFEDGDIDRNIVRDLIIQQLSRRYEEKLNVTICVPICFIEFESDEIEISDMLSICRMSEKFQISRYKASHFESTQESNVVQGTNFMVRLKGYAIKNDEKDSLHKAISNYWAYPIEIFDDLFAAIRIVVGLRTGYGQLLLEPDKWADEWTADLLPLYGTNIRAFNRNDTDNEIVSFTIGVIKDSDIQTIKSLFLAIRKMRENPPKKNPFNKILIAIQRLNRCMLREADDDTALDAIIGIETLLSGDTHGEITYTISNRIAVVAAKLDACPYSASDARRAMKKIYGLRSDIVHGRNPDKNSKITIAGNEITTKELAIDFLRYSLLFIIKNQDYLEVNTFEIALDDAIGTQQDSFVDR